ncbi:MAG: DNA polymerase I [Candidatus Bathyarchaeota archaeon B23]|nr:MAG: DNA polymerase I [Candidatus Bathyarchaeota archaeon B23]
MGSPLLVGVKEIGTEGRIAPDDLSTCYLLSAGYDGEAEKAFLRLYEPGEQRIYLWYDNTGHLPYCISKRPREELEHNEELVKHPGFLRLEEVKRYDSLRDEWIRVTRVVASNPLAIGGQGKGDIRHILGESWESHIRYYQNYIYDYGLIPGMPYRVVDGSLVEDYTLPGAVERRLEGLLEGVEPEFREKMREWARLLECPVPELRRAAIDIEVGGAVAERVPNPERADDPIIAISIVSSDGVRRVLLRDEKRGRLEVDGGEVELMPEEEMIREAFRVLDDYPIVLTFNGDDFDLRYLRNRARRLGFPREATPISIGRRFASLRYGLHIDLYRFFQNRSIQIYAFGDRYRENTLDEVASTILGRGKIEVSDISRLTPRELARYCLRDAELTYELTAFNDDLVMRLMVLLSRISKMTMEDVTRQGVSRWILTLLEYEHRRLGWLIPNVEDIIEVKGVTATKAIIKGKKYLGAIVTAPKPGVHFDVTVLDFASLYPSAIRNWNLSYETILCPHGECRGNLIPGTPHWVCTKRRGMMSLIIGSLRDLRVRWYKPMSKNQEITGEERAYYNVVQSALKVFLNAAYGVFGSEAFPLYCPPLAESTAAIGRYAMTSAVEVARKLGIEVVYGDTDSVFLEHPSERQIESLLKWADEELGIELDVDKVYRYVIFSRRKKNYLGVYPDGSVDIKGLTGKKRHIPPLLKWAFQELTRILGRVERPEEMEEAKEEIKRLVRSVYRRLRERDFELDEVAFRVMLGRRLKSYETRPQHVKAARMLQERGVELGAGDIISYVVTRGGVKPVQLASRRDVDIEKYIEYLESMFEQLLDALGIDFDELVGRPRATTLDSFLRGG